MGNEIANECYMRCIFFLFIILASIWRTKIVLFESKMKSLHESLMTSMFFGAYEKKSRVVPTTFS